MVVLIFNAVKLISKMAAASIPVAGYIPEIK
jgi:hypothetical protein